MTKKLVGLLASVALLGAGGALAEEKQGQKQSEVQQQEAIRGSEEQGQAIGGSGQVQQPAGQGAQMGAQQLSGQVVDVSGNTVHVQTPNGIIPLKLTRDTQFNDPKIKRARDIQEGQRIQASFRIMGKENVVQSLSVQQVGTGTGGGMQEGTGGSIGVDPQDTRGRSGTDVNEPPQD